MAFRKLDRREKWGGGINAFSWYLLWERIMYNKYCKLDELHLLLQCPRYNHTRETLGISDLIRQLNQSYDSPQIAYVKYWGKNTIVSKEELTWRTDCANMMKEVYLKDVVYLKLQIRRYG